MSARNLLAKSYSGRALPTKSSTVQHCFWLLSGRRKPRPSCCKNSVRLSVGRKNSKVSTSGISTPSLKISTTQSICISPWRSACCLAARSLVFLLVSTSAFMPAKLNLEAMNSACFWLTQNASALIA